jgi:hypothetical protein
MLNTSEIHVQLNRWLERFVEVPHPSLGGWAPCPYARAARLNNQIGVVFSNNRDLYLDVMDCLTTLDRKDVVVICFDHAVISVEQVQQTVKHLNDRLMPANYVILEDHPMAPESVNGVPMNFGHCGLLVVQRLDKLNTASTQLKEKGYYNVWSQTELNEVVTWRNEVR